MSAATVTRHSMMERLNDRCTYITGNSTATGQLNRRTPRLFLVKGDTAASKLNRHALDSELTEGMRADLPAPAQPVNSLPVKAKRSAKPSSE